VGTTVSFLKRNALQLFGGAVGSQTFADTQPMDNSFNVL